jgi:hypothetical protein
MTTSPDDDAFTPRPANEQRREFQSPQEEPSAQPWSEGDGVNPFRKPPEMNWLDKQFAHTSLPILVIFPLCCGLPAFGFGLAGVIACQHPKARRNAIIVLVISIVAMALGIALQVVSVLHENPRR